MRMRLSDLRRIVKEEVERELGGSRLHTEAAEDPDAPPGKIPIIKAVINGVTLTRAEEVMLINSQGTFDAAKKVYTLKSGKAIPMKGDIGRLEAREELMKIDDRRKRLKAAAGKGPKGKATGQRAFAAWVMKAGYG